MVIGYGRTQAAGQVTLVNGACSQILVARAVLHKHTREALLWTLDIFLMIRDRCLFRGMVAQNNIQMHILVKQNHTKVSHIFRLHCWKPYAGESRCCHDLLLLYCLPLLLHHLLQLKHTFGLCTTQHKKTCLLLCTAPPDQRRFSRMQPGAV